MTLVNTMTDTLLDPDGVIDKFGVPPERIVDYLSLMGDSVDNIPGVPKCGPKTAAKWIQEYGDLDGVIANAGRIKGKVGENLRAAPRPAPAVARPHHASSAMSHLGLGPTDLQPDRARTRTPCAAGTSASSRAACSRPWTDDGARGATATRRPSSARPPASPTQPTTNWSSTRRAFEAWMARLEAADLFAFDTETTGLDYMQRRPGRVCPSPSSRAAAAYVPVAHVYPGAPRPARPRRRSWRA